jgi:hypothetical protein
MATYKAINSGNADTLAIWETWNGAAWVAAGSLPTVTDDVYTNNFIVTVTTSQSYLSWNRSSVAAPLSITQGGQFQIDGANDILISGEIYGTNVNQTVNNPLSACVNRLATHTGTLSIIGNQNGGSSTYAYGFFNNSTFDFASIVGNQNGGIGSNTFGFYNNGASTFTSIVGNQNGGSVNSVGFFNNAASTFTSIVGNQNGGTGSNTFGFQNNAAATFTNPIMGNQIANVAYGFFNNVLNLNIPFQGNAYASNVAAICNNQATTTIIYTGNIYNNLGVMAIRSDRLFLNVTPTTVWEFSDFGGNSQYLYGAGVNTGHPIEADVRKDTVYGPNDEFEGTCAIPPKASVALNVPVDDTVGELVTATTPADFIAALKADELGIRLGKCATTEEVDSTVASYNS